MLEVGTKAPDFKLPDQNGEMHSLKDYKGKKVILYFYPKDNTSGCTKQACSFGELMPQFKEKGAVIIGVSKDSVASHKKFEEKYGLPFTLLSDVDRVAIEAYDVWKEKKNYGKVTMGVVRTTYLIDEKGVIQAVYTDSPIADYNTLDGVLQGMLKGDGSEDIVDLSVRLNVAAPNLSEEDYFQNEYTVSHLELFFFDAETKKFITKAVINDLTQTGNLAGPLRARFGHSFRLEYYSDKDIQKIIERSAKILGTQIETAAAELLAKRSRLTPRVANRLLKRVRDYADVNGDGIIDQATAERALEMLEIDELGLDPADRNMLTLMIEKYGDRPVGLNTISALTGDEASTIENYYEPFLMQLGMIMRTPRGRVVTDLARKHLGK